MAVNPTEQLAWPVDALAVDRPRRVEELVEECRDQLLAFFRRRLGEEAEDATQELFLRLWVKERSGKLDDRAKAYLFRSANNLAVDHYRRARPDALDYEECEAALVAPEQPEQSADMLAACVALHEAVSAMPEMTRHIFILHECHGLKYREISQQLGLSIRTVERHMQRGLEIIRKYLARFSLVLEELK